MCALVFFRSKSFLPCVGTRAVLPPCQECQTDSGKFRFSQTPETWVEMKDGSNPDPVSSKQVRSPVSCGYWCPPRWSPPRGRDRIHEVSWTDPCLGRAGQTCNGFASSWETCSEKDWLVREECRFRKLKRVGESHLGWALPGCERCPAVLILDLKMGWLEPGMGLTDWLPRPRPEQFSTLNSTVSNHYRKPSFKYLDSALPSNMSGDLILKTSRVCF